MGKTGKKKKKKILTKNEPIEFNIGLYLRSKLFIFSKQQGTKNL